MNMAIEKMQHRTSAKVSPFLKNSIFTSILSHGKVAISPKKTQTNTKVTQVHRISKKVAKPQFIIQYDFTYDLHKEWSKHPVGMKSIRDNRKFTIIFAILSIASFILATVNAIYRNWDDAQSFAYAFTLCTFILFILPLLRRKAGYKSWLNKCNKKSSIKIVCDENIKFKTGRGITAREYSEIAMFKEDDLSYIIYTSFDVGYRIPKNSFVKGSSKDFKEFMQSKLS